ncbi:NAD-binding protein [Auraticoccus monumenti]|uniref:NAD-binding protein n=1 Tax=Auraticoccus monumenti TaxID=675864 RepID=UPI0022B2590D|nr:NAD-binding protein [Auraticoccus monumenti]
MVTGPAGTAAVVKLCNQYVLFTGLGALYEAVDLAGRVGVEESVLLEALAGGTARSWAVETWGFYDRLSRDYDERDVAEEGRPWVKDLAETLRVASDHDLELPTARTTAELLPGAIRRHADHKTTTDGGTR